MKSSQELKITLTLLLITVLYGSTFAGMAIGWSNGGYSADPANPDYGTHDWIAQHALDWLPLEEKQYILNNLASYLYGTELPDNGGTPDGIGDTAKHHIYYNSTEFMTDDAAAIRAATEYNNALNYLSTSDLQKAAKTAGIMSHYIADMAVFGHVMGIGTEWRDEEHHSDYETYLNARTSNYADEFSSFLSFDGSLVTLSAYDAAKNLAYDTTFDVDGDFTSVWMDQNYNWSNPTFRNRAGESLNLAVNYLADVLHTLYVDASSPQPSPWGDWNHYHNYTEIVNTLLYLNRTYPHIVDVFSIGKSWQNRDIYAIRLTHETDQRVKPEVFFVGYHHAREPISAELPLHFAVEAATNYGTNETITQLLDYSEIYIVPALNVDALEIMADNEWQRKNLHPVDEDGDSLFDEDPPDDADGDGYVEYLYFDNGTYYKFVRWEGIDDDGDGSLNEDWAGGVDPNRNYGFQWNAAVQSGSPYPQAEDYRGSAPFSEPETQAIRDLVLQHNFKYAVSFHSGTEYIGFPWGYSLNPTPDDAVFREIAYSLSTLVNAAYGPNSGLYTLSGSWDDWMYGNRSIYALTCEIYGNSSAWQYELGPVPSSWWKKGVFDYFNPDPSDINGVIQRWLPVFNYVVNRAINEADVEAPVTTASYDGLWRNANFTIALASTDDFAGVAQTYYRMNEGATWTVSVDGQPFITTEGGNNKLEYWSVDKLGKEETPHKILTGIKLDRTAPVIGAASQTPSADVLPDQAVKVSVSVTDTTSGVKNATLLYTVNDGATWSLLPMTYNASASSYEGEIPPQPAGTSVKYWIRAYDNAANQAVHDNSDAYIVYLVVPEFASTTMLLLIVTLMLLTSVLLRSLLGDKTESLRDR